MALQYILKSGIVLSSDLLVLLSIDLAIWSLGSFMILREMSSLGYKNNAVYILMKIALSLNSKTALGE